MPRWAHRSLPPAYGARLMARGRRGPPVDDLDKPPPHDHWVQFLLSPTVQFRMSLDTRHESVRILTARAFLDEFAA